MLTRSWDIRAGSPRRVALALKDGFQYLNYRVGAWGDNIEALIKWGPGSPITDTATYSIRVEGSKLSKGGLHMPLVALGIVFLAAGIGSLMFGLFGADNEVITLSEVDVEQAGLFIALGLLGILGGLFILLISRITISQTLSVSIYGEVYKAANAAEGHISANGMTWRREAVDLVSDLRFNAEARIQSSVAGHRLRIKSNDTALNELDSEIETILRKLQGTLGNPTSSSLPTTPQLRGLCPKCHGNLIEDADAYGRFIRCRDCGTVKDLV
jgi:hypothetical protein